MTIKRASTTLRFILAPLLIIFMLPVIADNNKSAATLLNSGAILDFPVTRITDRIYVIYGPFTLPNEENQGFRNNPLIILTSDGVVVCDPGGSNSTGQMVVNRVKELTDKPIMAVFDSHAHGDHWLGNEAIKNAYPDVIIYGHEKMQSKLISGDGQLWLETINRLTKDTAHGTRVVGPDRTVAQGDIIKIGDTTFRIHHTGIAHTEGDIMVEIVEEKALFLGDIVRNKFLGIMEEDSSFKGNIEAIDYVMQNLNGMKYYIPGHGRAGDTQLLTKYRSYLSTIYARVKTLYETGMADFEMKPKIVKSLAKFNTWEGFDLRIGPHISRAYLEVEAEEF